MMTSGRSSRICSTMRRNNSFSPQIRNVSSAVFEKPKSRKPRKCGSEPCTSAAAIVSRARITPSSSYNSGPTAFCPPSPNVENSDTVCIPYLRRRIVSVLPSSSSGCAATHMTVHGLVRSSSAWLSSALSDCERTGGTITSNATTKTSHRLRGFFNGFILDFPFTSSFAFFAPLREKSPLAPEPFQPARHDHADRDDYDQHHAVRRRGAEIEVS